MRARLLLTLCFGVASLTACDQHSAASSTEPSHELVSLSSEESAILEAAGIEVLSPKSGEVGATGGVRTGRPTDANVEDEIAFSAVRHKDGSVTGEYQFVTFLRSSAGPLGHSHGRVACLAVSGNRATFVGVPQASDRNGPYSLIVVMTDNGEGRKSVPDQIEAVFGIGLPNPSEQPASAVCDLIGTPGGSAFVTSGNLQVFD